MNEPISVSRVRAAITKLRELEAAAAISPWRVYVSPSYDGVYYADASVVRAFRDLGPVMLEYVARMLDDLDEVPQTNYVYPVCRALVDWAEGEK